MDISAPVDFVDISFLYFLSCSNSSVALLMHRCFRSDASLFLFFAFSITSLLLLLLFIYIFYLGYQQRSISSHTDLFMYHSITMQLITYLGLTCYFCGGYINHPEMTMGGLCLWSMTDIGQALFHTLTCVERYLAVGKPITYLHLKQAGGVRIRNTSIGCVWLLSFGWLAVWYLASTTLYLVLYSCSMGFALAVISFCSISVLCTLKRPGPGDVGGNKECVDQSKQRAFYSIVAILGVLLLRSVGNLISNLLSNSELVTPLNYCLLVMSGFWLDLPNSLALPLLFLHRTGKLQIKC